MERSESGPRGRGRTISPDLAYNDLVVLSEELFNKSFLKCVE